MKSFEHGIGVGSQVYMCSLERWDGILSRISLSHQNSSFGGEELDQNSARAGLSRAGLPKAEPLLCMSKRGTALPMTT